MGLGDFFDKSINLGTLGLSDKLKLTESEAKEDLAESVALLLEEFIALREENSELKAENRRLRNKINTLTEE